MAEKIQRYGTSCAEHPEGCFVKYSAYQELERECDRLRESIRLQANAARAGMDAAKSHASILYREATKARAESSPEVLASERAINAVLTEENEALHAEVAHWKANHDNQVSRARFLIERGDIPVERVRAYGEMAALKAFHDFFKDRCEGLFAQFGMTAVDAYNEAALAGRAKEKA